MMSLISLNLDKEEKEMLEAVAKAQGVAVSVLIKKIVFDKLEDEEDLKMAMDYEAKLARGEISFLSHEEFIANQEL